MMTFTQIYFLASTWCNDVTFRKNPHH